MSVHFILLRDKPGAVPNSKGSKQHRWTKAHVQATSVKDLFENAEKYLAELKPDERWNAYYSVFNSTKEALRDFVSQEVLAFDMDGADFSKIDDYIEIVAETIQVPENEFTIVNSGNGLHFLFQLEHEITRQEISPLQAHYKEVLKKLHSRLASRGIPGKFDMILDTSRILRAPFTENRKPDKGVKLCKPIQINFTPHDIDLRKLSGLPAVDLEDQISIRETKKLYSRVDNQGIFTQCQFMNWVKESPLEVREPQGYAALSITARMESGRDISRALINAWTNSSSIASWDADEKIDQAMTSSGPRTCENINKHYGKCASCPLFGKITSPIQIQSEDFIKTEGTGFHNIISTKEGDKYVPNPHDLRRYLEREAPYKVVNRKLIYRWDGQQYARLSEMFLPHYAERHFSPHVKTNVVEEFVNVVSRYNCVEADWFAESSAGFVNFTNGALEWKTGTLHKCDAVRGFRYVLPFAFDPAALAPRWEKYLHDVFEGDKERAALIEEFMGYCLSNDPMWMQKALILLGTGANGKSTLINVMHSLAGKGNFSAVKVDRFNDPTYVQQLDGKLFNISGETPRKGFDESAGIKELIGGDIVTARELYGTPYTFQNRTKIVFACNEIPRTVDNTHGFYRRFWIVEFNRTFSEKDADTSINEKLQAELPGIFNRVYKAYTEAKARGSFTEPATSRAAVEALREEMDVVGFWIKESLTASPETQLTNAELYEAFAAEMQRSGNGHILKAWPSQRLGSRILKVWPEAQRYRTKAARGIVGLKFDNSGVNQSKVTLQQNSQGVTQNLPLC